MTANPDDLRLLRQIVEQGGSKYTAGNIDRRKSQRLVALDWLTETSVNISDVLYKVTDAGKAAALRDDWDTEAIAAGVRRCDLEPHDVQLSDL
jgi:DUF3860-like